MSKVVYRAKRTDEGPREPQWWYAYFLRDGSRVERDDYIWTLTRPGYFCSWMDMMAGSVRYGWK